ncbi:MAG: hypothetical protein IBX57_02540 [Gammaproteobacteria bacterium]|nr:hypothetical protein [Gammaproteobacteria bacterium]
MKPQAIIENHSQSEQTYFSISVERTGQTEQVAQKFDSFEDCLAFISKNDWELKRELPSSLHIPIQFMKP